MTGGSYGSSSVLPLEGQAQAKAFRALLERGVAPSGMRDPEPSPLPIWLNGGPRLCAAERAKGLAAILTRWRFLRAWAAQARWLGREV